MYISHINKYADAQAIQDALDAGTLANPYVAMTSAGTIDYNSLQPTPPRPDYLGVWSDNGDGVYTFQILDADPSYWAEGLELGALEDIYVNGGEYSNWLVFTLSHSSEESKWTIEIQAHDLSEFPKYDFYEGTPDTWAEQNLMTEQDSSGAYLVVEWDGEDTFVFQRNPEGSGAALAIDTYDIPYPEESGE